MTLAEEVSLKKILPSNGPTIQEVQKYIAKYINEFIVIKCGGSVLLEKNLFDQFIEDISIINKLGINCIVIHGGGKNIKKKLDEQNISTKFVDGLRVTDEKTIKVVEDALLELNSEIIEKLINYGCNVQAITVKKNNIIEVLPEQKDLGFVGNPKKIKKEILLEIIKKKKFL